VELQYSWFHPLLRSTLGAAVRKYMTIFLPASPKAEIYRRNAQGREFTRSRFASLEIMP
jgi:hypothetical protein